MSDYRYAAAPDLWVQDDHVIDGRDMPDELKPDTPRMVSARLVRDDAGQVIGAQVWEVEWPNLADPATWPPEGVPLPGRWVPVE